MGMAKLEPVKLGKLLDYCRDNEPGIGWSEDRFAKAASAAIGTVFTAGQITYAYQILGMKWAATPAKGPRKRLDLNNLLTRIKLLETEYLGEITAKSQNEKFPLFTEDK